MRHRLTIVQGHPDPGGKHLCYALANAYTEGDAAAGHEITRIELARLDFPILQEGIRAGRSAGEGRGVRRDCRLANRAVYP
jgi:putative NADPH-quinone reductase